MLGLFLKVLILLSGKQCPMPIVQKLPAMYWFKAEALIRKNLSQRFGSNVA
jgi:hypothetical protein